MAAGGGDGDCLAGDDGGGFIADSVLLFLLSRILLSPLGKAAACLQARSPLGFNSIDISGTSPNLSLIMFGDMSNLFFPRTEVVPKCVPKPHPKS